MVSQEELRLKSIQREVSSARSALQQQQQQAQEQLKQIDRPRTQTERRTLTRSQSLQLQSQRREATTQVKEQQKLLATREEQIAGVEKQISKAQEQQTNIQRAQQAADAFSRGATFAGLGLTNVQRDIFQDIVKRQRAFTQRTKAIKEVGAGDFTKGIDIIKLQRGIVRDFGDISKVDVNKLSTADLSRFERAGLIQRIPDVQEKLTPIKTGTVLPAPDVSLLGKIFDAPSSLIEKITGEKPRTVFREAFGGEKLEDEPLTIGEIAGTAAKLPVGLVSKLPAVAFGALAEKGFEAVPEFKGIPVTQKGFEFTKFEPQFGTVTPEFPTGLKAETVTAPERTVLIFEPKKTIEGIKFGAELGGLLAAPTPLVAPGFVVSGTETAFDPTATPTEKLIGAGEASLGAIGIASGIRTFFKGRSAVSLVKLDDAKPEFSIGFVKGGEGKADQLLVISRKFGGGLKSESIAKYDVILSDTGKSYTIRAGKGATKITNLKTNKQIGETLQYTFSGSGDILNARSIKAINKFDPVGAKIIEDLKRTSTVGKVTILTEDLQKVNRVFGGLIKNEGKLQKSLFGTIRNARRELKTVGEVLTVDPLTGKLLKSEPIKKFGKALGELDIKGGGLIKQLGVKSEGAVPIGGVKPTLKAPDGVKTVLKKAEAPKDLLSIPGQQTILLGEKVAISKIQPKVQPINKLVGKVAIGGSVLLKKPKAVVIKEGITVKEALKVAVKVTPVTKFKGVTTDTILKPLTTTVVITSTAFKPVSKTVSAQVLKQKIIQQTATAKVSKAISPISGKLIPPIVPPSVSSKPKVNKALGIKKQTTGWIPEIREKGKFNKFTKPFKSKIQADKFGKWAVDNSTSAQYRLKPVTKVKEFSKKMVPTVSEAKFRSTRRRRGVVSPLPNFGRIEKRRHRIDTKGEKRDLRVAKVIAARFPKKKTKKFGASVKLKSPKSFKLRK